MHWLQVLRWQGLGWVLFRVWRTLRLRLGSYRRKTPVGVWQAPNQSVQTHEKPAANFLFSEKQFLEQNSFFKEVDASAVRGGPQIEAEGIANGQFVFYHSARIDAGSPPDWFRCPWSGISLSSEDHWSQINVPAGVDVKNVWELSRFTWVLPLVRAYARDRDGPWADCFWSLFDNWIAQNPPNRGVQWLCGQETAMRLMAWSFALYGFRGHSATTESKQQQMSEAFEVSAVRIDADLSYALSQKNNHGISECVGLITVAMVFPGLAGSPAWYARGLRVLTQQCRELFYGSGEFSQHSSNYARLALQTLVFCVQLMRANDREVPESIMAALERGALFLERIIEPATGDAPNSGGNDGTLLFPVTNADYTDFRPAVAVALVCAGRAHPYPDAVVKEALFWMGLQGQEISKALPGQFGASTSGHPPGKASLAGDAWRATFHLPHFRHRPAHADLLHLDIWHAGRRLAVDPGTFSYQSSKPFVSAFKQAGYHNTVVVDGEEPMQWLSPFLAVPWPKIVMATGGSGAGKPLREISAKHFGYQSLPHPVIHQRTVRMEADGLAVMDTLSSDGEHRYTLHWLFDELEAAPIELKDGSEGARSYVLTSREQESSVRLEISTTGEVTEYDCIRADPASARGWQSRYYNGVEPAWSLRFTCSGQSVEIVSRFRSAQT